MKVVAASSFFKSLADIDSLKSKWYSFIGWFKNHFNKGNRHLRKVCRNGRPWDIDFLYDLEKAKIQEMIAYHKKYKRYIGVEDDIKWMELSIKLIDIFTEQEDLFHYTGEMKFIPIEGTDTYSMDNSDLKYHCDVNVNTRNVSRFVPGGKDCPYIEHWKMHPHELYILKAKHLYHKIREEKDDAWWD